MSNRRPNFKAPLWNKIIGRLPLGIYPVPFLAKRCVLKWIAQDDLRVIAGRGTWLQIPMVQEDMWPAGCLLFRPPTEIKERFALTLLH